MEIRDAYALLGRTAYGADGDRLGTVSGAYLDNETGQPSWITIERGGLFRTTTHSFVPLEGAEVVDDGVRVAVDADAVKRAPHVEGDRVLSAADERGLRAHYGLDQPGLAEPGPPRTAPGPEQPTTAPEPGQPTTAPEPEQPTTAAAEQDAMTRSEERARVGTTRVSASRAVLRKTRVVEDRTFSVPLGRDQVQVAYEPLPDGGAAPVPGQASQGSPQEQAQAQAHEQGRPGADADDEGWVVLYEERLVVRTEWVPVERVRLGVVGVQGEEVVQVDLRRERIDVDVENARQDRS
jgi:stress response protein YsnF